MQSAQTGRTKTLLSALASLVRSMAFAAATESVAKGTCATAGTSKEIIILASGLVSQVEVENLTISANDHSRV